MTLVNDPDVRRYRQEKARKEKRDAKLVAKAKIDYDRLCTMHRLRPLTTGPKTGHHEPRNECAGGCGKKSWGVYCRPCRRVQGRTFTKAA